MVILVVWKKFRKPWTMATRRDEQSLSFYLCTRSSRRRHGLLTFTVLWIEFVSSERSQWYLTTLSTLFDFLCGSISMV